MDDFTQAKIPIHGDLINEMYLNINLNCTITSNFNLKLKSGFTLSGSALDLKNVDWLESTNKGVKYEYDLIKNNNYIYLYKYKYTLNASIFTVINKDSLIIHENNYNNVYIKFI